MIEAQGGEWARLMLGEHMALRARLEKRVKVSDAEGVERSSARASERQLTTVAGKVTVPRTAYQESGREDLHPMDGVRNLPREMFSHGIGRMVAKDTARASFDEVVEIWRDYTGSVIAKRQVEGLAVRAAQDFERFYAQRPAPHDPSGETLVLSTDGKGIVMQHEDLREAGDAAHAGREEQPQADGAGRGRVFGGAVDAQRIRRGPRSPARRRREAPAGAS